MLLQKPKRKDKIIIDPGQKIVGRCQEVIYFNEDPCIFEKPEEDKATRVSFKKELTLEEKISEEGSKISESSREEQETVENEKSKNNTKFYNYFRCNIKDFLVLY